MSSCSGSAGGRALLHADPKPVSSIAPDAGDARGCDRHPPFPARDLHSPRWLLHKTTGQRKSQKNGCSGGATQLCCRHSAREVPQFGFFFSPGAPQTCWAGSVKSLGARDRQTDTYTQTPDKVHFFRQPAYQIKGNIWGYTAPLARSLEIWGQRWVLAAAQPHPRDPYPCLRATFSPKRPRGPCWAAQQQKALLPGIPPSSSVTEKPPPSRFTPPTLPQLGLHPLPGRISPV